MTKQWNVTEVSNKLKGKGVMLEIHLLYAPIIMLLLIDGVLGDGIESTSGRVYFNFYMSLRKACIQVNPEVEEDFKQLEAQLLLDVNPDVNLN